MKRYNFSDIKQCCENEPDYLMFYTDGRIRALCKKDSEDPLYRIFLDRVFEISSQKEVILE